MKISPKIGLWLISVLWVGGIAFLWAKNEYELTHGTEIVLKTAPIDPRDLFRGDYVTLRYEISELNLDSLGRSDLYLTRNSTVFVSLTEKNGYWEASRVQTKMPEQGVFLRGRVVRAIDRIVDVKYGIESYFVPEGKGKEIEKQHAAGNLKVLVSVSPYGKGKLKGLKYDEDGP